MEEKDRVKDLKNQVTLCVEKIKECHWNQKINTVILKHIDLACEAMATV